MPEPLRIARERLAAHVAKTPLIPLCELKEHSRFGGVLNTRMKHEENVHKKAVTAAAKAKAAADRKAANAAAKAAAKAAKAAVA